MNKRAYIKPTKPSLVMGLIISIAFLIFGVFFFTLLSGEPDAYIGQGFLTLWIFGVLVLGIYFAYSLINYDKNNSQVASNEIVFTEEGNEGKIGSSFDIELRKLENLKKDGLINEEEFVAKRSEIMKHEW